MCHQTENRSSTGLTWEFDRGVCLTYVWMPVLLIYAHRSRWSIGHQRPPAIVLCSGLLLSFRTSWSPTVSALLQCLASNCCEAGLSSSSPADSRSGLGVWCWMLDAGFLRVCPIQPHFLRSICLATGSCPARSHRSSFRLFSCLYE